MDIVVTNLHETGTGLAQQVADQQEPVSQISKIGVDMKFPSISKRPYHLWFLGEILVPAIAHVPLIYEWLKI